MSNPAPSNAALHPSGSSNPRTLASPGTSRPAPSPPSAVLRQPAQAPRSLYLVNPVTPAAQILNNIVPSVKPAEVFASLAELCVPALSESCSIILVEADRPAYQLERPVGCGESTVASTSVEVIIDATTETYRYRGSVAFGWHRHRPTATERAVCELLVSHCSSLITQQGLADVVLNLEMAVHSNRRIGAAIGILMGACKITEQQAFAALRARSQSQHRKVREIAEDVLESGWLEG